DAARAIFLLQLLPFCDQRELCSSGGGFLAEWRDGGRHQRDAPGSCQSRRSVRDEAHRRGCALRSCWLLAFHELLSPSLFLILNFASASVLIAPINSWGGKSGQHRASYFLTGRTSI